MNPAVPAPDAERSREAPKDSAERLREAPEDLVAAGICLGAHPCVTVELYGSLRLKTGRDHVPMRADTIGTAVAVLRRALPQAARLLPEGAALAENFRFSINGRAVTTDLAAPLGEGDRVILFSASVGG